MCNNINSGVLMYDKGSLVGTIISRVFGGGLEPGFISLGQRVL